MVNYGSLYRSKASSTTSRPSDPQATTPSAANAQDPQQWAQSTSTSGAPSVDGVKPTAYLTFSDEQQDALLTDARANAAALLVDAIADADKWQFVTARGPLNVYELRTDSMDRVSSMTPADQTQLPLHMHTMLATTRVRATLDDFMRLMASVKRDTFQNVQAALFEDRVQMADVFTSFGTLCSGGDGRASASSTPGLETEQYAVKYVAIRGRPPRPPSGTSAHATAASNSLKFGGKNRHRERQAARLIKRKGHKRSKSVEELGLTMCLAEYATIRRAHLRGPMAHHLAQDVADQRVGIISHHSIEDPAITRYCRPIVTPLQSSDATPPAVPFAMTARALIQFSGVVAYPVASSIAGDKQLEVLIKFSCYDGHGVTSTRRMNMLAYLTAFQHLATALLVLRLRESPFLTSEKWVKSKKSCCVCGTRFSMARRKHHCRLCGDVACAKCSAIHQIKLGKAGKCPFRICVKCDHRVDEEHQRPSRRSGGEEVASPAPSANSSSSIQAFRRRIGSGGPMSRHPEDDDDDPRSLSMTLRSRDHAIDSYDARTVGPVLNFDRTVSSVSGSTVSSSISSRGLGAFGKSSSSKTLSISSSSFAGSFYSKPSNATTVSSSRDSRADSEGELDVDAMAGERKGDSDTETCAEVAYKEGYELEMDDLIDPINNASSSSSSSSPSNSVLESDRFYKRFSELSLMDFHDSEFDLSLQGGLPSRLTGKSVYDFDDSEADPESDREKDLGDIGEEEGPDEDAVDGDDICDFHDHEVDAAHEEEDGMEFHDSNVGLDYKLQDLKLHEYLGLEELEEGEHEFDDDDEEGVVEVCRARVVARSRGDLLLADRRTACLAEYGILDSGKEHIYDLVAKQAAQHSSCSLATISFVDDRREFIKASFGLGREVNEVPLSHSLTAELLPRFCTSSELADVIKDKDTEDSVTVLDAKEDVGLAANAFVLEAPNLRFIMGVPFRARDGTVLGALIVADAQPRTAVSARQRSLLRDLAEQVSALLADLWTRTQERAKLASSQSGQLRDQLVDLLSQSYSTGLQMQQNELKMEQSTSLVPSSTYTPQYEERLCHMQSVEL